MSLRERQIEREWLLFNPNGSRGKNWMNHEVATVYMELPLYAVDHMAKPWSL